MAKLFLFLGILACFLACGQKSVIKNAVRSETTAEAYGDGKHVIRPLFIPLASADMAHPSDLADLNSVARGIGKMFFDLGAGLGLGRQLKTMLQPVPKLPTEFIKGLKLTRVFFYVEPIKDEARYKPWLRRLLTGDSNINFNFVDKIAVKVKSVDIPHAENFEIDIKPTQTLGKKEATPFQYLFDEDEPERELFNSVDNSNQLVLVRYDRKYQTRDLKNNERGQTWIINSNKPAKTKNYLVDHPHMKGYFKSIRMLANTLIVELKKDPVFEEGFRVVREDEASTLAKFGIKRMEKCNPSICLDFDVPNVDLLPLLLEKNGIQIDAYINADKYPGSFQLKGFLEFESKFKLPF